MWHNWTDPSAPAQVEVGTAPNLDLMGHEFAHAVSHAELAFGDALPGWAMGESFADVFAEFMQHYAQGSTDWTQILCGSTIYSLANPPAYSGWCGGDCYCARPHPDHWSMFRSDCTYVHWNRTITSKAGYLLGREPSEGAATHWGLPVTGIGETAAGAVWYRALTQYLASTTTYTQFRTAIYQACYDLLGGNDYLNCLHSVDAIGLWTPDSAVPWQVVDPVSLSHFSVGGEARRWLFYRDWSSDVLAYR
jgi:Zn-dependent metalloprotease